MANTIHHKQNLFNMVSWCLCGVHVYISQKQKHKTDIEGNAICAGLDVCGFVPGLMWNGGEL